MFPNRTVLGDGEEEVRREQLGPCAHQLLCFTELSFFFHTNWLVGFVAQVQKKAWKSSRQKTEGCHMGFLGAVPSSRRRRGGSAWSFLFSLMQYQLLSPFTPPRPSLGSSPIPCALSSAYSFCAGWGQCVTVLWSPRQASLLRSSDCKEGRQPLTSISQLNTCELKCVFFYFFVFFFPEASNSAKFG